MHDRPAPGRWQGVWRWSRKGFSFSTAMLIICVIIACNRSSCIRTMIMTCMAARK